MKLLTKYFLYLFLIVAAGTVQAQVFGKNKVNYSVFTWQFFETEHFDIYYTEGGYKTALIASEIAEDSYDRLSLHWNFTPRKRIPILVNNSHNDFSETNVILEILEEGVGGFTELFKNRVVIPWDGSLAKFRHVIHHELTHALMFDMLYGGVLESIFSREYMFQLPLWFVEGLAEHESQYWGTEPDMIVRDGIITGYIPPVQHIYGGYLAYKGGESFFKFLQEEYGNPTKWIIGEILQSLATTKNVEKTFKSIFGKSIEDLSKEWHRKLRENHWPEVAGREISEDFALKLTDHRKLKNYLNVTPSFNPTGDRIAFLTDRNGYKEIMLMSAIDGKLIETVVKGEKAGDYEEMHWMRGGITWSPDGKSIAFATKAGAKDAIHIAQVSSDGYDKVIKPDMDAIYSPDWSPDGSKILFCGIKNSKLDLFTVDIESLTYKRLTNDFFDESNPRWSPDGKKIVFSSDRLTPSYEYSIEQADGFYNIFIMDADGSNIRQITTSKFHDSNPSWSPDGENIVFTSDRNGISNLYYVDLKDNTLSPLMNLLTGASTPCWSPDGNKIAFTSFKEGGWDIYLLKRPLKRNIKFESITPTTYRKDTLRQIAFSEDDKKEKFIINDNGSGQKITITDKEQKPYKLKFSPDMFNAFASYNTFYGIGGMGQLTLSDIMGNHRLFLGANLLYSLEESDGVISYYNLKRQTNYGISAFHYKTYYRSYNRNILSDRIYGGTLMASRPFNKFKRQDFSLNLLNIERDVYQATYSSYYNQPQIFTGHQKLEGISTATLETEFVNDTSLWGHIGPINGSRYKINIEHAPSIPLSDISFTTVELDYRKYYRFGTKYNIVTRFSGGASLGENPRLFFLGGTSSWLNAQYKKLPDNLEYMQDMFFARYPFPFRGFKYYEEFGQRYFLTNFEFRFPFIDYIALNWPIPLAIGNINGVLFTDIGSAWYKPSIDPVTGEDVYDKSFNAFSNSSGTYALDDIKMSWGVGLRMNLGFAVFRFDTAWRTNLDKQEPKPIFYLSIGPDF